MDLETTTVSDSAQNNAKAACVIHAMSTDGIGDAQGLCAACGHRSGRIHPDMAIKDRIFRRPCLTPYLGDHARVDHGRGVCACLRHSSNPHHAIATGASKCSSTVPDLALAISTNSR